MQKQTLEKVFEYASSPVHGTLSRKLRKGVKIQINEGKIYEAATLFLGDEFVRVTVKQGDTRWVNGGGTVFVGGFVAGFVAVFVLGGGSAAAPGVLPSGFGAGFVAGSVPLIVTRTVSGERAAL